MSSWTAAFRATYSWTCKISGMPDEQSSARVCCSSLSSQEVHLLMSASGFSSNEFQSLMLTVGFSSRDVPSKGCITSAKLQKSGSEARLVHRWEAWSSVMSKFCICLLGFTEVCSLVLIPCAFPCHALGCAHSLIRPRRSLPHAAASHRFIFLHCLSSSHVSFPCWIALSCSRPPPSAPSSMRSRLSDSASVDNRFYGYWLPKRVSYAYSSITNLRLRKTKMLLILVEAVICLPSLFCRYCLVKNTMILL